jgi:hypothetical protein
MLRVHNVDGPAVEYMDGYSKYFINGLELTEEQFNKLSNKQYTLEDLLAEPNEERKAVALLFYQTKFGDEFVFRFLSDKLKKVSKNDKFNAGLYWYLIRHLTQIKHSLIPIFDNKKITNKLFWKKQKIKLIKDNKYVDQLFLSNLKTQYLKQNRHCLNVQSLNKNKFIDLSLNDLKLN